MNIIRLIETVKLAEGWREYPYQDHKGKVTIGYGTVYAFGEAVTMDHPKLTRFRGEQYLYYGIMSAIVGASKSVANFSRIGSIRREALAEMAYQMGVGGLMNWRKTRGLIEVEDWAVVYHEALDSELYRDRYTRDRAIRYATMLKKGDLYENRSNPWI